MKYLHEDAKGVYHLDHRLTPEVSAMFCAMSSRMPGGGIVARYTEIVEAIKPDLYAECKDSERGRAEPYWSDKAEDRLCVYPIHPRVQQFFDRFVLNYGHSSIMELTGNPAVYTEGLSWYAAYLLFDSPICSGQEFSTRAVRHKDWPMASECEIILDDGDVDDGAIGHHPVLVGLHDDWFEVFEAEVDWWKSHFSSAENRAAYGIKDKEPFRPALDRARWAIPGTIATGCAHTGHLRERARAIRDGSLLAQASGDQASIDLWNRIREGYQKALPGLEGMGLREAVYGEASTIPGHLRLTNTVQGPNVTLDVTWNVGRSSLDWMEPFKRSDGERSYVDPIWNSYAQVGVVFECSLAVSRDWHRHRTMYPWVMRLVRDDPNPDNDPWGDIRIDTHYEPKSELGKAKVPELLRRSTEAHDAFMATGNQMKAMLCLPLGTRVEMAGSGGLRDAIYMIELRRDAHGANFEYQEQATQAAEKLRAAIVAQGEAIDQPLQDYLGV